MSSRHGNSTIVCCCFASTAEARKASGKSDHTVRRSVLPIFTTHDAQPVQTDTTSVIEPPSDMSQHLQGVTKRMTNCIMQSTPHVFCMLTTAFCRTSYVDRGVKNCRVEHHNLGVSSTRVPRNRRIARSGSKNTPSGETTEEPKILDPVRHDGDIKMTKLHLSTGNGRDDAASFPPGGQIGGSQNSAE